MAENPRAGEILEALRPTADGGAEGWVEVGDGEAEWPTFSLRLARTAVRLRVVPGSGFPPEVEVTIEGEDGYEIPLATSDEFALIPVIWEKVNWALRGEAAADAVLADLRALR